MAKLNKPRYNEDNDKLNDEDAWDDEDDEDKETIFDDN